MDTAVRCATSGAWQGSIRNRPTATCRTDEQFCSLTLPPRTLRHLPRWRSQGYHRIEFQLFREQNASAAEWWAANLVNSSVALTQELLSRCAHRPHASEEHLAFAAPGCRRRFAGACLP